MEKRLNDYYLKLKNKYNIKNKYLEHILENIKDNSIFIDESEEKILYIDEIINYKKIYNIDKDVILLVDICDNNFVAFNLKKNKFQYFNIIDQIFFKEVDIKKYIDILKKN